MKEKVYKDKEIYKRKVLFIYFEEKERLSRKQMY